MIVPSEGSKSSRITIIGEAPGKTEVEVGRPFAGASGDLLNKKLHRAGLGRYECYITNVVKTRPDNNDFGKVYWSSKATGKGTPTQSLLDARKALLEELDTTSSNIYVCLGANALWALTGQTAITKWRGSLFKVNLPSGRAIKVLGTIHPAACLRQWEMGALLEFDLKRVAEESHTPDLVLPKRSLLTGPTILDVGEWAVAAEKAKDISFDIETSPSGITCISFAYEPNSAISIPTTTSYWGSEAKWKSVWESCDYILNQPGIKVGQNMSFDVQYLMRFIGILPKLPWFDTMLAHHACYSELRKSLAVLTSIYTREPFYKDDLKTWQAGKASDEMLWEYNAKDAAVTLEIKHRLVQEMAELDTFETFTHDMLLLEPLIFMMLRGMRMNPDSMLLHRDRYEKELVELEKGFEAKFPGINPHSAPQMAELCYNRLKLKPIMKTRANGTSTPTTDKDALEILSKQSPEVAKVIEIRNRRKILSTYIEVQPDHIDGRFRFSLSVAGDKEIMGATGAETGRLSSSASIFNCGTNVQNIPKSIRDFIIPEDGLMITAADLKGAEALIVFYLAEDMQMINLINEGRNVHTYTATNILWPGLTEEDIEQDKKEKKEAGAPPNTIKYDIAKRVRHSGHYLGSWVTLSKQLKCSAKEAKLLLERFRHSSPNVVKWQEQVKSHVGAKRCMSTCLGRKRFFFGRYGPDLFREAIAYEPQETVAHVINIGLRRVYDQLCTHPQVNLLAQVHDEIVLEHPIALKDYIHKRLHELLKVDLTIKGRTFSIPVEISSGMNWRDLEG